MELHVIDLMKSRRPEGVSNEHVKSAREHAVTEYPKEAVGLLTTSAYHPCANISPTPETDFEIDPVEVLKHDDILAMVHSHPDGEPVPTAQDMASQIDMDIPWGILTCTAEDCSDEPVWFGDAIPPPPLEGRLFVHGITDCYSLIRDWYRQERGIVLRDFPRDDDWWDDGQNLYEDGFQLAGFKRVTSGSDPEIGDVFMARFRSPVVNHGGIYVGGGLILHHVSGHMSVTSPVNIWNRAIDYWVRYEG